MKIFRVHTIAIFDFRFSIFDFRFSIFDFRFPNNCGYSLLIIVLTMMDAQLLADVAEPVYWREPRYDTCAIS